MFARTPSSGETAPKPASVLPTSHTGSFAEPGSSLATPPPRDVSGEAACEDGRVLIQRRQYASRLATAWSGKKKWCALSVAALAQLSMNLNTTLYSNALHGIASTYNVGVSDATWGAAAFLIAYAFGCELWAPWSEEFGRKRVLQYSMGLVNTWGIVAALAPNLATLMAARTLGGLSTAGGSVTLAMITDMYGPNDAWFQHATNFMALASLLGSVVGAIAGGFAEAYLPWRWCLWLQVIFGGVVQLAHALAVSETRAPVIMDAVAKGLRRAGQGAAVYGPGELAASRFDARAYAAAQWRPFRMLLTEPIVTSLALLSGFSDALIFVFVQSFGRIYAQWGFGPVGVALAFIPIGLGYVAGAASFVPAIRRNAAQRAARPHDERAQYESRLWWLCYTAPLLPAGLLVFALTAAPPLPWIASMAGACAIGVANYAIYMATIDYTLRAYGPYAASATGGNGWARDFLAGILTPFAGAMFDARGTRPMLLILFGLALALTLSVFGVYRYGPWLRARSRFARTLESRGQLGGGEDETPGHGGGGGNNSSSGSNSLETMPRPSHRHVEYLEPGDLPGSRSASRPSSVHRAPGSRLARFRDRLGRKPDGGTAAAGEPIPLQPHVFINEAVQRIVSEKQ